MKIGILTLPFNTNYGGILQAYALQTVLECMGHEVCVIDKKQVSFPLLKAPLIYYRRIKMNMKGRKFPIFYEFKAKKEDPIVRQNTNRFISKYIKNRSVKSYSETKDLDIIVVGSDQIWRPKYFRPIRHAYLDFAKSWNVRRIAYAASFGTDKWEYKESQARRCSSLIKLFAAVSVREDSGVALCRERFGVEAQHVLDPTLLLNREDYIRLFEASCTPDSPGNLLCYILDEMPEKTAIINKVAKERGLVPFSVKSKSDNINDPLSERVQPPVEQWLRGFYDAEFVITDSFHACVFSILFNKPFLAIGNIGRGMSRFTSLLSMFGLEDRLIDTCQSVKYDEINWGKVNSILQIRRNASQKFITESMDFV